MVGYGVVYMVYSKLNKNKEFDFKSNSAKPVIEKLKYATRVLEILKYSAHQAKFLKQRQFV